MLLAKRLFSIANWSTLRKQPHGGIPQMRTMTVSKCGNSRWLEQPALLFRVRLDARGGARCANRLVGVFARLIWKGRGAGRGRALQRYTGRHRKNGERELKLNGSTRLRAAIRAAVSP